MTEAPELLALDRVTKEFTLGARQPLAGPPEIVHAVDAVTLAISAHETLGLVGESGCGKTTIARLVLRLETPTGGRILFRGVDIGSMRGRVNRDYRASVQAVFQNPWASLNPRMRARTIIEEPLVVNGKLRGRELTERVNELLAAVGLDTSAGNSFPHEFSGGMRQRIAIARALALSPALIVLDEPVSALDVSIRAQIVRLLKDLQTKHGIAYLLIAHGLGTVRDLSHRLAVMYLGSIVETGRAEEVFVRPRHPYTVALMSAALPHRPDAEWNQIVLEGDLPSPTNPPEGCRFHTRCWLRERLGNPDRCVAERPQLREVSSGHATACHYAEQLEADHLPEPIAR